jgi:hypothetical protein
VTARALAVAGPALLALAALPLRSSLVLGGFLFSALLLVIGGTTLLIEIPRHARRMRWPQIRVGLIRTTCRFTGRSRRRLGIRRARYLYEILFGEGVLVGSENDRTVVHLVLDRQRCGPVPAVLDQAPDSSGAEQSKAFSLVEALRHPPPGAPGRAGRR